MLLIIDGQPRAFVPIRQFRKLNRLPEEFGLPLFSWKEQTGSLDLHQVHEHLSRVRAPVLRTLAKGKGSLDWLSFGLKLELVFRERLRALSAATGLSIMDVEYISACFGDLCDTYIYCCLRARSKDRSIPYFQSVYLDWVSDTVHISQLVHCYVHDGEIWRVQVVTNAFGHVGLIVDTTEDTHYVEDNTETRPISRFIVSLLLEVASQIGTAIGQDDTAKLPTFLEPVWRSDFPFQEPGRN